MMKYLRLLLMLPGLLLAHTATAKSLDDYLGHVKSLSARFEQFVYNEAAHRPEKSFGRLHVASPDRFRLEYDKPYKQLYIADGKRLLSYDEDLEQVTIKPQKDILANSPAMVLSNPAALETAYVVQHQGLRDNVDWFYLTPRNPDSGFDHVRLGFAGKNLYVMELFDSFGQKTQLHFSELRYNAGISADTFTFTPPAGVDVIGDDRID